MEWWEELTHSNSKPLSTLSSDFDLDKIVEDVKESAKVETVKPKTILNETQKHAVNIDRRLVTHGNVSEMFPDSQTEETTPQTRTAGSYQEILDKTMDALRLYRKLLG